MKYSFPSYYFPTTVLLLDDNKAFLSGLRAKLNKKMSVLVQNEPENTLAFIKKNVLTNTYMDYFLPLNEYELPEDADISEAMHISFSALSKEVYNPNRFSAISVLVIDYDMPVINGIEFCNQLKNTPIKKILLTGVADQGIAVKAFNEGLINQFILKDSPNMLDALKQAIGNLQYNFFCEITQSINQYLTSINKMLFSHPAYNVFVQSLLQKENITEYYMLDSHGSMLMLDHFGNPMWLLIKSAEAIQSYAHIAIDNEAPSHIIKSLTTNKNIPFFLTNVQKQLPVTHWDKTIHFAEKIPEIPNHYYALIKGNLYSELECDKIISFKKHLMK